MVWYLKWFFAELKNHFKYQANCYIVQRHVCFTDIFSPFWKRIGNNLKMIPPFLFYHPSNNCWRKYYVNGSLSDKYNFTCKIGYRVAFLIHIPEIVRAIESIYLNNFFVSHLSSKYLIIIHQISERLKLFFFFKLLPNFEELLVCLVRFLNFSPQTKKKWTYHS